MASAITAAGGSIDVNGIVTQLMAIEREPLAKIQKQQSGINTKLSAWGKLKSALSELQSATDKLTSSKTWQNSTAKSSDENSVAASGGAGGARGTHALTVRQLAQSQAVATRAFDSPDAVVGGGTLSIQLGSVNEAGNTFNADGERAAVEITVPANATLKDVRDLINNSKAGVSASLVNDGSGTRLMISGQDTGAKNAFQISANPSGDSQLASLNMSATEPAGANGSQRTQIARDAQMSINGLAATSASNQVTELIEGVTLELKKADATPVSIQVETDKETLREDVDAFISAYNKVNSLIATETRYDPGSRTAGTLQGNASVIRIQNQLRALVRAQPGDEEQDSLSRAGFELGRDGSLSIKAEKLDGLLNNPARLRSLLAGDPPGTGRNAAAGTAGTGNTEGAGDAAAPQRSGLARQMAERLKEIMDPKGTLNGATEALNRTLRSYSDKQDRLNSQLARREEQLRKQYSALDVNLTKISNSFSSIAALLPR